MKKRLFLNRAFLAARLDDLRGAVDEMRKLSAVSAAEFARDTKTWAATETFLRRALESMFDIGRHILARAGGNDVQFDYKSIAHGLGQKGVVARTLSDKLVPLAGYRNRIVHHYFQVSPAELYRISKKNAPTLESFVREIAVYLGK